MAILTINHGSSSVKAALFSEEKRLFSVDEEKRPLEELVKELPDEKIEAVGHRIVHGGEKHFNPTLITEEVFADLKRAASFDPLHLPPQLEGIETMRKLFPDVPQIACFDTAFHKTLPEAAKTFALPYRFRKEGIYRYGFHGLSYEYIMQTLGEPKERLIIAHLGSGASMAAVQGGKCCDTTMGFTSASGLVMATRLGDADPGLLLYLEREKGITAEELGKMVNRESGLKGISGLTGDMKALLESEEPQAELAVEIFCYQAKKFIGALAAAMGGVETLVFTGGIGENSHPVREKICCGLEFLGIEDIHIIRTDEELMIARHTGNLIKKESQSWAAP